MLSRRGAEIKGAKNVTVIAEGVKIDGKINCPGSARIDGSVKGDIVVENEIIIGKEGKVDAKMKTKDAVVAGSY